MRKTGQWDFEQQKKKEENYEFLGFFEGAINRTQIGNSVTYFASPLPFALS